MRLHLWLIAAILVGLTAPAEARLTRALTLDGDFAGSDMVMIGTVESVAVVKRAVPGPFSSTINVQELGVRVDVALRNSRRGQLVRVRHPKVLPTSRPVINGFGPVELRKGATHLFFLKRTGKTYKLAVVEDHTLIGFSRNRVRALGRQLRKLAPRARLLEILRRKLARCAVSCAGTIWLTDKSNAFAARYTKRPKAKRRYLRDLVKIARTNRHNNTRLAAFTVLGRHDERSVIPVVVRAATKGGSPNVVSWLQGYKPAVQVRALRTIVGQATDHWVLEMANRRLRYLQKRLGKRVP